MTPPVSAPPFAPIPAVAPIKARRAEIAGGGHFRFSLVQTAMGGFHRGDKRTSAAKAARQRAARIDHCVQDIRPQYANNYAP